MKAKTTLICTVGISLFSNIGREAEDSPLRKAHDSEDWAELARALRERDPLERTCGPEINSNALMLRERYVAPGTVYFLHSDTDIGRNIAAVLAHYYTQQGGWSARPVQIGGLRDDDARRFRNEGLRNLIRETGKIIRDHGEDWCAINATGGYKAQISVMTAMGQALQVPVYYKHELFEDIISLPPLPISLDSTLWIEHSDIFTGLARVGLLEDPGYTIDNERLLPFVEKEAVDGKELYALTPAGQLFHQVCYQRIGPEIERRLPPAAIDKKPPREKAGENLFAQFRGLETFLQRITDELSYVVQCRTFYSNPDLPKPNAFTVKGDEIVGEYSVDGMTARFVVATTAEDHAQKKLVCTDLNRWLSEAGL